MNFQGLFYPKSIAIIGASTRVGSVGNDIVKNLVEQGFKGFLYPVNPKATVLYGKQCFSRIEDISGVVDLAVIAVPETSVLGVAREAVKKGVQAMVVISSGFKESGNSNAEQELRDVCAQNDVVLIGPNCLGVINAEIFMNASFAPLLPKFGDVAFLSQSGALCASALDFAQSAGIGFSKFVSTGNKALISEVELLEYFAQDESTRIVVIYTEGFRDPDRLRSAMSTLHKKSKPVIVLKSGSTEIGIKASSSHTGSLAGSDTAYTALFEQTGMIRANSFAELFDLIQVFSCNILPSGNRLAIVTNAGGPGVLTADSAVNSGLELANFDQKTTSYLKSILPASASSKNPVDVLGDASVERYEKTLDAVSADPNVDMVIAVLTPQTMTDVSGIARSIVYLRGQYQKPIVASFVGEELVRDGTRILTDAHVASIRFCESASSALGKLFQYACISDVSEVQEKTAMMFSNISPGLVRAIFDETKKNGYVSLPEAKALDVFRAYKFPTLKSVVVHSSEEAEVRIAEMGGRVAMKIFSRDILHKSDVGGVALGVTEVTARKEYETMMQRIQDNAPHAYVEGVLLAEMAPEGGVEMIVGSVRDAQLGHVLAVGFGGIYVEIFKDISFGIIPVSEIDVQRMIDKLKSSKILNGARGGVQFDVNALSETLLRTSKFLFDFPEIKEFDINPLLVFPKGKGVCIVDGRITLDI